MTFIPESDGSLPPLGPGAVVSGSRGRYRLEAEVGRGGFGVTYRGRSEEDGATVIVKTLQIEGLPSWKGLELFEREAAALRGLSHPSIPGWIDDIVLGAPDAPSGFALVMTLMPGPTLAVAARTGLSPAQMLSWLHDMLVVLAFIHGRSPPLIHRDVNPKNIILQPAGPAALVDFGCVQAAFRSARAVSTTSAGTFGYAPLEQFVDRAMPASDLYGLGMTYLAVATGREPADFPLVGLRVDVETLIKHDPRLERLIQAMVEPDPRNRLQSADEGLVLLRPLLGESTIATDVEQPLPVAATDSAAAYIRSLARRLSTDEFTTGAVGEIGRAKIALAARREAHGLEGLAIHLVVARADAIDGDTADRPVAPIPSALFVQAVANAHAGESPGLWQNLLGQRRIVVPVIVADRGIGFRTAAHIIDSLREPDDVIVIPVLIDLTAPDDEAAAILTPRSLMGTPDPAWEKRLKEQLWKWLTPGASVPGVHQETPR